MSTPSRSGPWRLFGHPVHPILVHLPLGVLPLVPIADALALWSGRAFWWEAGFRLLIAGLAGILAAAGAGFVDYAALTDDPPAERTAMRHMIAVIGAGALYLVRLLMHPSPLPPTSDMEVVLLCTASCGCAALVTGGALGGKLVHNGASGRPPGPA